jgi:hypothetical protein
MQPVTKDTLDDLSKKIYVKRVCIDNYYKQLQEINANIKGLQDDINSFELNFKELNKAWETKKASMSEDITELNKMKASFDGEWTNQWPITHDDMDKIDIVIDEIYNNVDNVVTEGVHSQANLIKTLPKYLVEENWPYMRVKNTIKWINSCKPLDKQISLRISHYDGLQVLAKYKNVDINQLINMNLNHYTGSMKLTRQITGRMYDSIY